MEPLSAWYKVAKISTWRNLAEVKAIYSTADYTDELTIFNIGGNKYRLIVKIEYAFRAIYVAHVFTHAEYDKWCEARNKKG